MRLINIIRVEEYAALHPEDCCADLPLVELGTYRDEPPVPDFTSVEEGIGED